MSTSRSHPALGQRSGTLSLQAAALFLAARLIGLAVLAVAAGAHSFKGRLASWDGGYYLAIAQHGYPHTFTGRGGTASPIAFFPAYPALIRTATFMLPGPDVLAAVAVSLAAGAAAAAVIARVFVRVMRERVDDRLAARIALVAVAAWAVEPASFVMAMAYSESVFVLLAATCVLFALNRRWVAAGAVAVLVALTRANGLVFAAGFLAAAIVEIRELHRTSSSRPRMRVIARRVSPPLLCGAAAVLGFLGYISWIGIRVHRGGAWFTAERAGWNVYTDGGIYLAKKVVQYATHPVSRPSGLAVILVIVATLALLYPSIAAHANPLLATYTISLVMLAFTTHGAFGSIPRLLLPVFPIVLPVASAAAKLPARLLAALYLMAALAVGAAGLWVTGQTTLPP